MNAEKLTQKSAEAIRSAQEIALEYGNPQIEQVHLLWALLQDSEGLIPQLLAGMGVTVPSLQAAVKDLLARQPRVSNSGHEAGKIYISGDTEKALNRAEKVAGEMKDEYTSVEHLFLGLLDTAGRALGYQQVIDYLDGLCDLDDTFRDIAQKTKRLARKQMGWFGRDPRIHWLHALNPRLVDNAMAVIDHADAGDYDPIDAQADEYTQHHLGDLQ